VEVELSGSEGCFRSEDILFEEVLLDQLSQVLLEGPAVDCRVSLAVMIGAIVFCSESEGSYRIGLEHLPTTGP